MIEDLVLISADSHVYEPQDLWTTRVERRHRDRFELRTNDDGSRFLDVGGYAFPVFRNMLHRLESDNETKDDRKRLSTWTDADLDHLGDDGAWNAESDASWDPTQRLADQDADGVAAEVIYPSWAPFFFYVEDAALQRAGLRAYNAWMAELCAHAPSRLHGIAAVSLVDVPTAIRELERARASGLVGVLISSVSPASLPYSHPAYDPFWEAAAALGMPVSLHIQNDPSDARPRRNTSVYMALVHDQVAFSIGEIVMGGALERFPSLKLVAVETDVGWLPGFVRRLDRYHRKYREQTPSAPPSDSCRRVYATFVDEPLTPDLCALYGGHNYLWGNDFPHSDSTWPHSRKVVERDLSALGADVIRNVVGGNVARLYGLAL